MSKRKQPVESKRVEPSLYGLIVSIAGDCPIYLPPLAPVTGRVIDHAISEHAGKDVPRSEDNG